MSQTPAKTQESHPLDGLTGGAFSAPTSGERTSRIKEWLATEPSPEQLNEVFKELSARDKGAARPVREKLDEIKRAKGQETIGAEWAEKAQALLSASRLNLADAMAWQRDAAKAGAPLSKEPLASIKTQLADRVKLIEDLQHRVQVQREAAVLLAQRIEVLSTKPWRDAEAALDALKSDVGHWEEQAASFAADSNWASVDAKFPPLLEASKAQLQLVWQAFQEAVTTAVAAAADAAAPLPPVPVWADELRAQRGVPVEAAPVAPRPKVDPELKAKANDSVKQALEKLEKEVAEGHGKASTGAASALRNALKENAKLIDHALENQAHAALAAAGELEGWQRWRADQLREELVAKAEGLLKRPEGQAIGGRKMQETLRGLREQWKETDQGGVANHALWKRFDDACNEAHKVVEAWLEKLKAQTAEHRAQRLALIEEVKQFAADRAKETSFDWKAFNRALYQFGDRWRDAGHLNEKTFAELQPQWKAAIDLAAAPLVAAQNESLDRRKAMIAEATELGASPMLRVDAIKQLQQRWQAEAQTVPLDRKHEQKLWDAFRKPIDEAFNRKTQEREQQASALSERDRAVIEASKALEEANASGDVQKIRAAMTALDAAMHQTAAPALAPVAPAATAATPAAAADSSPVAEPAAESTEATAEAAPLDASEPSVASGEESPTADASEAAPEEPKPAPKAPPKKVIAVRGDDRPGMKKAEPAAPMRGGRPGERRGNDRGNERGNERTGDRGAPRGNDRGMGDRGMGDRGGRFDSRDSRGQMEDRGPRLGDTAFRAQRDAVERAQMALKKLAAQAHGEALTQLMTAWEKRDASALPSAQELGSKVTPSTRTAWTGAVTAQPNGEAAESILRLEMAAEVPTPADQLDARRALQLKLLTKRNDPAPAQTWGADAGKVLATSYDEATARRLQNALKALLRRKVE